MKTIVVKFEVWPHQADYLRGALSALLCERMLSSSEEIFQDPSGAKYSTVSIVIDEDDHEKMNMRFIEAHAAVERLTGEEVPWEVHSEEM